MSKERIKEIITMTEQEKSILLSKFEKIRGYSSSIFNFTDRVQFDAFCWGYNLAKKEQSEQTDLLTNQNQ